MNKDKLQRYQNPEDVRRRRKSFARVVLVLIILILLFLCFRSCRARDEPIIATDRVYEEDYRPSYEDVIPSEENKRLSLAFSDNYRITDEHPVFYIGYPEENIFDVVLTIRDLEGTEVYRTDFVAPGTNVAIDGTGFLAKGEQQVECLVSIYGHDSGVLISDCTTVVLNIKYE